MRDASFSASKLQSFPDERAAPRRRAAPATPAPDPGRAQKKKKSVIARVFAPQRMGVLLLLGIGGLAFVGVPMNALFFQEGRHPAPLFTTHLLAPEKSETASAAPTPPERPAQIDHAEAAKPDAAPAAAPKTIAKKDAAALKEILKSDAAPAQKPEKKKAQAASRDAIGALLGGGQAAHPAAAAGPEKGLLSAQRTLQRLGYIVKPDGKPGVGTRQAIEKFERDNGLPAKGDPSPKILKLIAARGAQ